MNCPSKTRKLSILASIRWKVECGAVAALECFDQRDRL